MLRQRIGSLPFSKNIKTMIRYFEELDHLDKQLFIKHLVNLDQSTVQKYISELKLSTNFRSFIAYGESQEPFGGVCAQLCSGPIPFIPSFVKSGSIWGLWGEKDALNYLIEKSVCYLKQLGVTKGMAFANSDQQYQSLTDLKFSHSNNLSCDLNNINIDLLQLPPGITVRPVGPECDDIVYDHWVRMWTEKGVTFDFLREARKKFNYRTTAAFDGDKVVGTVSNNLFFGVEPTTAKIGSAWAVYINSSYRRCRIGTRLVVEMEKYFKDLGCPSMRLIYASEEGRRIYKRNPVALLDFAGSLHTWRLSRTICYRCHCEQRSFYECDSCATSGGWSG